MSSPIHDDPFARIAAALPGRAAPAAPRSRPRSLARRSQPSFSDLAPKLPPPVPSQAPAPAPFEHRVASRYEPVRPAPIPFVPTVIVADEPPAPRPSFQARRPHHPNAPTVRARQRLFDANGTAKADRRWRVPVLVALCTSMAIFALGVASFVVSHSPVHAPLSLLSTHASR